MSRASRSLRRLVVVGAGTAAIATGVVPLATGTAFAAVTSIAISPTSDTETVNDCNVFTVTTQKNEAVEVEISQTVPGNATTNTTASIGWCNVGAFGATVAPNPEAPDNTPANYDTDGNAAANPCDQATNAGTTPDTATCDAGFTSDANGKFSFGVISDNPGTMSVTAFNDTDASGTLTQGDQPRAAAQKTWVADTPGGNTPIDCTPKTDTNPAGQDHIFTCTVKTASGTGARAQDVKFIVQPGGPDYPSGNQTCNDVSAPGAYGTYSCTLHNGGGIGTDQIFVWVDEDHSGFAETGEPSTTISKTYVNAAPNNSIVAVDCSPNEENPATLNNEFSDYEGYCNEPLNVTTVTFTATVTAGGAPQSGKVVNWTDDGFNFQDANANGPVYDPANGDAGYDSKCITDNSGKCSITVSNSPTTDGDHFWAEADVPVSNGGINEGFALAQWNARTSDDARNIALSPASATQPTGGAQDFTATVTERDGNPVPGVCVGFNEAGPGHVDNPDNVVCGISNSGPGAQAGSYDTTCVTSSTGTCRITVVSQAGETGAETITATIDPANYGTNNTTNDGQECTAPANRTFVYGSNTGTPPGDLSQNAPAGNCTASGQVNWKAPTVTQHRVIVSLHLTCFSPRKHVVKCIAQLSRPISGVTVVFRNAAGTVVGRSVTNSAGKAKLKLTGLKSHKTHRYHAHAKRSSKTFSADSNTAKVTVS